MAKTKKRILWMDVLNICSCIGVLILHTNSTSVHEWDGIVDQKFIWGLFTHTAFYWPVPVFLMLSGCNIICYSGGVKRLLTGRIKKTVIPFISWSIIYAILLNIKSPTGIISPRTLYSFINGTLGAGYMWFFIPLFAFYLSSPFLSILLKNSNGTERRAFIGLAFIFCSVEPFVSSLIHVELFRYNLFPLATSFLMYPVLGWIICNDKWFDEHHRQIYVAAIICAIFHFSALYITIVDMGLESKIVQNTAYPADFIMATAVFLFFKRTNWEGVLSMFHLAPNKLVVVCSCSFGIYLIQNLLFIISSHCYNIMNNHYYGFIVTYLIGLVCIMIMKKIPIVNKIVP